MFPPYNYGQLRQSIINTLNFMLTASQLGHNLNLHLRPFFESASPAIRLANDRFNKIPLYSDTVQDYETANLLRSELHAYITHALTYAFIENSLKLKTQLSTLLPANTELPPDLLSPINIMIDPQNIKDIIAFIDNPVPRCTALDLLTDYQELKQEVDEEIQKFLNIEIKNAFTVRANQLRQLNFHLIPEIPNELNLETALALHQQFDELFAAAAAIEPIQMRPRIWQERPPEAMEQRPDNNFRPQ